MKLRFGNWFFKWCVLVLGVLAFVPAGNASDPEPRTQAEARAHNRHAADIPESTYQRWTALVEASAPEKRNWLATLEENLGGYYFPAYLNRTLFGPTPYDETTDAWAYVKDDPNLPRILILGDSISRAYTALVRQRLKGKANVHRAPANCGPTHNFIEKGEIWLKQNGSAQWDFIVVNFGIHDASQPDGYEKRLRRIFDRLKQTGAKEVFWVRTTPWGKDASVLTSPEGDNSRMTNPISDRVAHELGATIVDAHAFMTPLMEAALSRTDFTHWSTEGYHALGGFIETSISSRLNAKSDDGR